MKVVKIIIIMLCLAFTINVCSAKVVINVGVGMVDPDYYPPDPYGPPIPYGPYPYYAPASYYLVWVPPHWEHGYWIPGRYVQQYIPPSPGPNFVWMPGSSRHGHHGYWQHR